QPGTATVKWLFPNQVPDNATVTVNSDGTLDLNGQTEAIGPLIITDGQATTGATGSGALTVTSLNMTGGTFTAPTAPSSLGLPRPVTATSDATATATVQGSGVVQLGATTKTFTVADGAKATDLLVSAVITGSAGSTGLTKAGPGTMQVTATETYTGLTT